MIFFNEIFYDGKTCEFITCTNTDFGFTDGLGIETILDYYRESYFDEDQKDFFGIERYNQLLAEKEEQERLCHPKGFIVEYSDEFTALLHEIKANV